MWEADSKKNYSIGAEGRVELVSEWKHENANERREHFVPPSNCPTQAKTRLEWATRPKPGLNGPPAMMSEMGMLHQLTMPSGQAV
jgi:hypothetical protein